MSWPVPSTSGVACSLKTTFYYLNYLQVVQIYVVWLPRSHVVWLLTDYMMLAQICSNVKYLYAYSIQWCQNSSTYVFEICWHRSTTSLQTSWKCFFSVATWRGLMSRYLKIAKNFSHGAASKEYIASIITGTLIFLNSSLVLAAD